MLKISIITPSYNQGNFLEETICSVLNQNYPHLEYVVIDGGSTDSSPSIIEGYADRLTYWVSESDRGQAHAINKGLERATGDIVAYINSDDVYLPGAFAAAIKHFEENPQCEWLCGQTIMFGEGHQTHLAPTVVPKSAAHTITWNYKTPQPGFFWRRDLLKGGFSEKWDYLFDHESVVRLLLAGHECHYLPLPIAGYRLHPDSKTVSQWDCFEREFDAIAKLHEGKLDSAGQRWSVGTRLLRRAIFASREGRRHAARRDLLKAMLIHPESIKERLFWGCLRRALMSVSDEI